jgi:hypothetical protein
MLVFAGGCASLSPLTGGADESAADDSLTRVVSELKLHLRDDTYRYDRAVATDGRNVYAVALWKLDRLAGERQKPVPEWENADFVIEFARGKALERLRRYGDALSAFRRVGASGSVLGDAASERGRVMESFAVAAAPPDEPFATPARAHVHRRQDRFVAPARRGVEETRTSRSRSKRSSRGRSCGSTGSPAPTG